MSSTPTRPGEAGILVDHVPAASLFWAFFKMSVRSWGGGSATIYIMHNDLVRRGWINSPQFALDFGLSRLVPGINLLSTAIIFGYRLNGLVGSIAAILGLMLPASLITLGITAVFAELTGNPLGNAVVQGAVPVTASLTFALAYDNAREIMPRGEWLILALMAAYAIACFVLVAFLHISVAFVIIGGALIGALLFSPSERSDKRSGPGSQRSSSDLDSGRRDERRA